MQSELIRLNATHDTSIRKRLEVMEESEKLLEKKKIAENHISTLERNLNTLQENNNKLKSALELSERKNNLLEKNMAKANGK